MSKKDIIATELLGGHPVTGAYDANDETAAGQMNAVNRTRNLSNLTGDQLFSATDETQFAALTDSQRQLWLAFCGRETINPFSAANIAFVQWVFGGGSATVTNLAAIRTEAVSRATELGISFVRPGEVAEARA